MTLSDNRRPTISTQEYSNISENEIISKKDLENKLSAFNPSTNTDAIKFNQLDTNKLQIFNN